LQQPSPVKAETPPLPDFKPQPIVDAKEYNELSMGLIGMALIGGAVSKGNWLGVSATLNGALDGYLKGNKEAAAKGFQDYKTQFEAAKAKEERANKEFEQALTNRNKTINEKLQMVKLIAAKYDRQDLRMAAEQKSIDAIWKQYEAHRTALNSLEVRHSDIINNKMEREGRLAGGGGGSDGKLTPEASQLAYDMTARGIALPGGNTKYGNSLRIQMLNEWAAAGKTADDMAGGRADVKANQSALTQVTKDLAAIGPYKRMLDKNAGIVIQLAQKVEDKGTRTNSPWINEKLNTLQTKGVSDPDVQEMMSQMHFVQTEAARVLNNPRLVGQLTDSARKDMQDVVDGSMPVKTISRVVKRIMTDGNNRYDEMINEKNSLSGTLHGGGGGGGGGGAAAPGGGAVMKFDAQGNPVK
jgi:hypothetical protein